MLQFTKVNKTRWESMWTFEDQRRTTRRDIKRPSDRALALKNQEYNIFLDFSKRARSSRDLEEQRDWVRRDMFKRVRSVALTKSNTNPTCCSSQRWTRQGERVCGLLRSSVGQRGVIYLSVWGTQPSQCPQYRIGYLCWRYLLRKYRLDLGVPIATVPDS